jgi:hypothetical protein
MGLQTLYCSREMSAEHLVSRELATEASIDHWKMRRPERLDEVACEALVNVCAYECQKCSILDGELSMRSIRVAARRKRRATGLNLIVLDYDELIRSSSSRNYVSPWTTRKAISRRSRKFADPVLRPSTRPGFSTLVAPNAFTLFDKVLANACTRKKSDGLPHVLSTQFFQDIPCKQNSGLCELRPQLTIVVLSALSSSTNLSRPDSVRRRIVLSQQEEKQNSQQLREKS